MLPLSAAWTCEKGLPLEARIPELWDTTVSSTSGASTDTVCSFLPRMVQRDQFQAQGTAQVPSQSQTCQRGQSMGQGRGQGPHAGTSGTQGCVYTIVPQTEPT